MRRWARNDEKLISSVELDWDYIVRDKDPFRVLYMLHMVYPYSAFKIGNETFGLKHIEQIIDKI